jgi:hypothetical protein
MRGLSFRKLATLAIAGLLGAQVAAASGTVKLASQANASAGDFNASTVARKYNFRFTGRGADGTVLSAVGWFEANDSGRSPNIFAGSVEVTVGDSTGLTSSSMPVSPVASKILLKDATNGIYDMFMTCGQAGDDLLIDVRVLFDDVRGHSGKVSGTYVSFIGSGFAIGAVSGEIAAR